MMTFSSIKRFFPPAANPSLWSKLGRCPEEEETQSLRIEREAATGTLADIDIVAVRVQVVARRDSEVPSDGFDYLHVANNTIRHADVDQMWAASGGVRM